MIKSFLDNFEDFERPLLGPNYWLLTKMGLIMPEHILGKFFSIFWLEWPLCYFIAAFYELYLTRENIDLVLTNLKIAILGLIIFIKANIFIVKQKKWVELIAFITESDKYERERRDDIKGEIIDRYTKYCRRITYSYTFLVLMTCVTLLSIPFVEYYTMRNDIKNGTAPFPHIMRTWMPFDKNHSPGNWITVVWHASLILWGTGLMPAIDSTIMVTMVFFGGKLDLLQETSKQMLGTDGKGISDEEADKILCELHHTHMMLLKYLKLFNALISPIMFTYVIILSTMLCASAYQLSVATTVVEMLLLLEYLLFGIVQMFLFCWFSTDVLIKHKQLMQGPYESEWWCANARQKRNIAILSGQFNIKFVFTAGPFTNLTLATFVTIIKGSYSYFTLLRD